MLSCSKDSISDAPIIIAETYQRVPEYFPDVSFPQDNQYSNVRWELGKKLFFDKRLSIDKSISCASCHKVNLAFSDSMALSSGAFDRAGTRNASSLTNVAYHPYFMREGGVPSLEMQVLVPIQEENEFAHNIVNIVDSLESDSIYQAMSREAYGRELDPFVITRAISCFERTLISGNSRYDQYQYKGNSTAITDKEKKGMQLFFSSRTNCSTCHGGFNFTNYAFENNGLDSVYQDEGRKRFTGKEKDNAKFKVPTLRNIALTSPYMHDGRFSTLNEVMNHYNSGGMSHPNKSSHVQSLNLTTRELEDLLAFLHTLTDDEFINDQRWQE